MAKGWRGQKQNTVEGPEMEPSLHGDCSYSREWDRMDNCLFLENKYTGK
jgi:hypothetical protein